VLALHQEMLNEVARFHGVIPIFMLHVGLLTFNSLPSINCGESLCFCSLLYELHKGVRGHVFIVVAAFGEN